MLNKRQYQIFITSFKIPVVVHFKTKFVHLIYVIQNGGIIYKDWKKIILDNWHSFTDQKNRCMTTIRTDL
jgi:hypothetical protein